MQNIGHRNQVHRDNAEITFKRPPLAFPNLVAATKLTSVRDLPPAKKENNVEEQNVKY
jgi:hypothetical protein